MIWDVAAVIQGGSVEMRVEAKTEEGVAAKVLRAAAEQGVDERDVVIGFVRPYQTEEQKEVEELVASQTNEMQAEMLARVRKGAELLNHLACDVMEAEYAGADVRLLLKAVEDAQALLTNAVDATEREEKEE